MPATETNATQSPADVKAAIDAATQAAGTPIASETPAAPVAPEETQDTNVADLLAIAEAQRGVQILRLTGLLASDDAMTKVNFMRRFNHALEADYRNAFDDATAQRIEKLRTAFKKELTMTPDFKQLVANGHVNRLLEGYLEVMADYHKGAVTQMDSLPVKDPALKELEAYHRKHERLLKKYEKYAAELAYLKKTPKLVQDIAREFPQAFQANEYLPIGELAILSGLIDPSPEKARDLVEKALGNAAVHPMKLLDTALTSEHLDKYKSDPQNFDTQIRSMAKAVKAATTPLANASISSKGSGALKRVQALSNLLSAEVNAAIGESQDPAMLVGVITGAKVLVKEYESVALSLLYHEMGKGPAAGDPRIKTMRNQLETRMKNENITLHTFEEAEARAVTLARKSAKDLLQTTPDKPLLSAKLQGLLGQVDTDLAKESLKAEAQLIPRTQLQVQVGSLMNQVKALALDLGLPVGAGKTASR